MVNTQNSLNSLKDEELVGILVRAKELKLDYIFIQLLEEEIERRELKSS